MGGYGGDFPAQGPRKMSKYDYGYELYVSFFPSPVSVTRFPGRSWLTSHRALQLGHRLLNPLSCQMGSWQRKPPVQNLLHLVWMLLPLHCFRLLLYLRDQGAHA